MKRVGQEKSGKKGAHNQTTLTMVFGDLLAHPMDEQGNDALTELMDRGKHQKCVSQLMGQLHASNRWSDAEKSQYNTYITKYCDDKYGAAAHSFQ